MGSSSSTVNKPPSYNNNNSNSMNNNNMNNNNMNNNNMNNNNMNNMNNKNAKNSSSTNIVDTVGTGDNMNNIANDKNVSNVSNNTQFTNVYGNINFITFLSTIYARLAYCNDHKFLLNYNKIFGSIITTDIMSAINSQVSKNGIKSIMNDKEMFNLTSGTDKFGLKTYTSDTNQVHLEFLPLAEKINIALGEQKISDTDLNCQFDVTKAKSDTNLIFISIADSNYGGIYIFGDKRMPNIITVGFRGTYSVKSAASYSRVSSLSPGTIGTEDHIEEKYLTGIFKLIAENIHSIIYSMTYISKQLGEGIEKQIITTGHSLGGGLTTIFAYLWVAHIKSNKKYQEGVYKNLNPNIACISIAAPRVLDTKLANLFCCLTNDLGTELNDVCKKLLQEIKEIRGTNNDIDFTGRITYIRSTTYLDPVTSLPLKGSYQHPCSNIKETGENTRMTVNTDCYVQIENSMTKRCWNKNKPKTMFGKMTNPKLIPDRLSTSMNYNFPLNCVDTKEKRKMSKYKSPKLMKMPMGYHIMYNGISFAGGLDPLEFIGSANPFKSKEDSKEIVRTTTGDTVTRIVAYPKPDNNNINIAGILFFDLTQLRIKPDSHATNSKLRNQLSTSSAEKAIQGEDIKLDLTHFDSLIQNMKDYDILTTKAPLNGTADLFVFKNLEMGSVNNTLIRNPTNNIQKVGGKSKTRSKKSILKHRKKKTRKNKKIRKTRRRKNGSATKRVNKRHKTKRNR